ncbi:protein of unknown function [Bradyrhizobium vignae]|uniref:Uncharacterized protein n=1 Tax=Bradyrhizobium vignae TaxID=1549949 RepID=A0A2U3PZT7_9BRAD|nr:protein of unknown function [Bradyrhizobium vignae]
MFNSWPPAGSIRTQPAGLLLFLPFAAALLRPLGRTRCSVARLLSKSKSQWDEVRNPNCVPALCTKMYTSDKKDLSSGAGAELRSFVGITLSRRDPKGLILASNHWFPLPAGLKKRRP